MKAIIEIKSEADMFRKARKSARKIDAGESVPEADYHLGFISAEDLFKDLTPARLALIEHLKALGPSSIYALAKALERNYSNVHGDVTRLIELDLIEKQEDGKVLVPWESIQVTLAVGKQAA